MKGFLLTQCVLGNFNMAAKTKQKSTISFAIADSTLKEYDLITLIYNRISCRLDLLSFWAPKNIILYDILRVPWPADL